jgi:putative DNA primase/helicase
LNLTEKATTLYNQLTPEELDDLSPPPENASRKYVHTDIGAGDLFADTYGDEVRYVALQGVWYIWDGKRWVEDTREQIKELAKALVITIMPRMAEGITDDTERMAWLGWARKLQSNKAREEILKSARSKPEIAAELSDFDADSRFINLQNGIFDLQEKKLIPHDRELMLSKIAGCSYNQGAKCERWMQFTMQVMDGNVDAIKFLRKAAGYSIAGRPVDDCLFILYGEKTRNGKSTFCRAILNALGDYGRTALPESIAVNRNRSGSGPNSDIARLRGSRFVNMAEPGKGMELDAALVKSLTGRDPITARFLHREFFEFIPLFVLFINTNYLPRVDDMTLFSSGRIFCIPFPVHFPPDKQERGLVEQFTRPEAASAIFNWILEGYEAYQTEGIKSNVPNVILEATREYSDSSDTFGQFLRDCIMECINDFTSSGDIYQAYARWVRDNGFKPMSNKSMVLEMKRRGYKQGRTNANKGFHDIVLTADFRGPWPSANDVP